MHDKRTAAFFSHNLAVARRYRGLTQQELAERSGVRLRTIQRIEASQTEAGPTAIDAIAAELDLSAGLLTQHRLIVEDMLVPERHAGSGRRIGALVHDNIANLITLEQST